ncbi:MAG: hypothetical protein LBG15_09305 [Dysgonamonadaceae bacterium]|jgi:hypothetical protein|nr:hypothetical protein [Dysgonamonadaceae bacterium]
MLSRLEEIIKRANPAYTVEYEELSMMNVSADEIKYTQPFAYIEEFTRGEYGKQRFYNQKTVEAQIWFCRFCQFQSTAREREAIREQIEAEIVLPFMEEYKKEAGLFQPETWKFFTPPPRFDANETSIMLQFDFKELKC